jgi:hypothetical protein
MLQLLFATSMPSPNLLERIDTVQLAEDHGHKLLPAGVAKDMTVGWSLLHG